MAAYVADSGDGMLSDMAATNSRYRVQQSGDVVRLEDTLSKTTVSICPGFGNNAFDMQCNGVAVLWRPAESLDEFRAHSQGRGGVPFLAPWANRLDETAFYANGQRFPFDLDIGNVRGATPIHGLLMRCDLWRIVDVAGGERESSVTSRLEFFRFPLLMKQFPFAHAIDMTHRLFNGALEVSTRIENLSAEPMPVAIGFHPYFRLTDCPREDWMVAIGARTRWLLSDAKLPTGETEPIERTFEPPSAIRLQQHDLDHVFSDLVRDRSGHATLSVSGAKQRIDIDLGPKFHAAVVYAPKNTVPPSDSTPLPGEFVCLEPMAGVTNSMNLAHRGVYNDLQYIPPGGTWEESFTVRPSGF